MSIISPHKEFLQANLKKPIVLIGTGGAGKTTIGQLTADALGLDFIDIDKAIEQEEGQSIPDIFNQKGEAYFRELEKEMTVRLVSLEIPSVVATGGGAFMNLNIRNAIRKNAISVFLKANLEELLKRVGTGEGRPLFDGKNPKDVLSELISTRYPTYAEADLTVYVGNENPQQSAHNVLNFLYKHLSPA